MQATRRTSISQSFGVDEEEEAAVDLTETPAHLSSLSLSLSLSRAQSQLVRFLDANFPL